MEWVWEASRRLATGLVQEADLLWAKNDVDVQREGGMRNGSAMMTVKSPVAALPDVHLYTCIFVFLCFLFHVFFS